MDNIRQVHPPAALGLEAGIGATRTINVLLMRCVMVLNAALLDLPFLTSVLLMLNAVSISGAMAVCVSRDQDNPALPVNMMETAHITRFAQMLFARTQAILLGYLITRTADVANMFSNIHQ